MKRPTSPLFRRGLVLPTVLAVLASGCASASAGRERTSGLFDDDVKEAGEAYPQSAPGGYPGGYPAAGSVVDSAPESMPTVDIAEERGGSDGGIFDFNGLDSEGPAPRMAQAPRPAPPPGPPPPPSMPSSGAPVASDAPPVAEPPKAARLVIYKGSLTVLVPAVEEASARLAKRAEELGGYVESQSGNSGSNNATLSLRVPAEKFYLLVGELGGFGQVTQKNISASDVTKQVFDIELRLETAERSRQRLLDLLKTATKMEEILQIEGEVRRLTDEIEGMKGQLRFLKDQVAFSTLAVTFYSNAPPPTPGPSRTRSRFEWINQVGIEHVLFNF